MKGTVLLTGFAGFIGSQILRDLLEKGYKVIGLDNMSEGSNPDNFKEFLGRDDFFPIFEDMNNVETKTFKHLDYIINCGACSHVDRSWDQVNKFIDSNVKGPIKLAQIAIDLKVKKFVQVSTDEVFADSIQPFNEASEITPQNAYATSKASAEMFLRNYYGAFKLPLIITNGANTYGPRQLEEKIIPLTIHKIVNGEKVPLYKTKAQRMWLHVQDHSSAIIAAMEKGIVGNRYCIAPEHKDELYTHELVEKICNLLGKEFKDCIVEVEDRPNYDLRYYMLNDKAGWALDWKPTKHIEDELEKVVAYYKQKFQK